MNLPLTPLVIIKKSNLDPKQKMVYPFASPLFAICKKANGQEIIDDINENLGKTMSSSKHFPPTFFWLKSSDYLRIR